jgi:hypothetical protein
MLSTLAKNHKAVEAAGLVLALVAWSWDIGVQSITRRADIYERQLLHIISSGQIFTSRERASLAAIVGALAVKHPELNENELAALAWQKSVVFREMWWEHSNTIAMWLDRTLFHIQKYGEALELPPPASFHIVRKLNDETHALLHPNTDKGQAIAGSRDVLPRESVSKITHNLGKLGDGVQTISMEVVYLVQQKREQERNWQLVFAAFGATLLVIGKLLGWQSDRENIKRGQPDANSPKSQAK